MNYEEPIHQSLTSPVLWMGVPRVLLILEGFIGALLGIIFKNVSIVILLAIMHGIMVFFTKIDPKWLDVFLESKEFEKHYYR